jgi:polysaccharide export outer membrane protein
MSTAKLIISAACAISLSACSLPRGAAVNSEVLRESNAPDPSFQVIEVTRNTAPLLAKWPHSGWHGHYHWFAADRAPDSSTLQTGDTVEILVWDNQDNSLLTGQGGQAATIAEQSVSASGQIFLPYIGEVIVRGLTEAAARRHVQEAYDKIQPSVQVQLRAVAGRNNSVDVVSGVGSPGRYPLESRNTQLLSILAQSGGVSPDLRNPLVRLQRGGQTYQTRVNSVLKDASRNVRVRGGDQVIVVEDDRSFNALGATGSQQLVYFEKDRLTVMDALSKTGGLNASRANPKGVLILRDYEPRDLKPGFAGPDQQQVVFTIDLTSADGLFAARQFLVQPGDTLLATESPVNAATTIIGLFGTVIGVSSTVNNL